MAAVSEWTGWAQTATPLDPGANPASASLWTVRVSATTAASPSTEWWIAGVAWEPAHLMSL